MILSFIKYIHAGSPDRTRTGRSGDPGASARQGYFCLSGIRFIPLPPETTTHGY